MPPEQELWKATPAIKSLAFNFVSTLVVAVVVTVVVYAGYQPVLHFLAGISRKTAEAVAASQDGLRWAAILLVVGLAGSRVARLVWRVLELRGQAYRLSNQRLVIETGVLTKTIVDIDLRTIDEIIFFQTFGERLLGVGQISIVSSEPDPTGRRDSGMRARLVGVVDPRTVREKIRDAVYQATGNQVFMRST